ncbi:hypothetical protein K0U83_23360 [bacterium]|nr:hypothetical protein [bacterium]
MDDTKPRTPWRMASYSMYSVKELVRMVDNLPDATSLEKELANRLDNEIKATRKDGVEDDWK